MSKSLLKLLNFSLLLLLSTSALCQQLARTADRANAISLKKVNDSPAVKWKFQTKGAVFASPIVAGNLIITGSTDSTLYALEKNTGKIKWKYAAQGQIRSSVAIDNQSVFFLSSDGRFHSLDLKTGRQRWSFLAGAESTYDAWDYFHSSPAVANGKIYFGSGDKFVYALDAATGSLLWKFETGGPVHASPTLADGAIFIGSFDGYFYCINEDGSLRWKFKTIGEHYFPKGEIQFHAAVADSTVYFCSRDFNVYALKMKDGTGHWVYHEPGSWTSVPSVAGDRLLVTMSDSYSILTFDKASGTKIHESPVPLNVFSSASINDSSAYFGSLDGSIYNLHIPSGSIFKLFQTDSGKKNQGRFLTSAGKMRNGLPEKYNYNFATLFGDMLSMGGIFSTVWIDDGMLFFGSADGCIYAVE